MSISPDWLAKLESHGATSRGVNAKAFGPPPAVLPDLAFDPICITLDLFVPSAANLREHWAAKHRRVKREREMAHLFLRVRGGKFPDGYVGRVVVTLTRTGGKQLDDDNLRSAFKAVRDGVADWLGIDDGNERIEWRYEQRPGGKRQTIIEVATLARRAG